MKFLVLNGPNINMLGIREPEIYGRTGYEELLKMLQKHAEMLKIDLQCRQSNHEGELVDMIQQAYFDNVDGIIINPAAYTHTSIALLDALKAVSIPAVEVHISDINEREDFRQKSFVREACIALVSGEGTAGYIKAMDILYDRLKHSGKKV